MTIRIIARLDVKNDTIVKGVHLEGLRVVGVPFEAALGYYQSGADEILYMDAVASLYERNSLSNIVSRTSEKIFVPMTVGGGLRNISDITTVLRHGADKVAINTAAVRSPEFVREASLRFGSQCIVGSIEAKKIGPGRWEAYVDTGRQDTGLDALEWAEKLEELGAGEILVTSVDQEGMKKGFEIELIKRIVERVKVPVVACGGAGKAEDVLDVIEKTGVRAVACASLFHYKIAGILDVKRLLKRHGVPVRLDEKI
jgi:cyclase